MLQRVLESPGLLDCLDYLENPGNLKIQLLLFVHQILLHPQVQKVLEILEDLEDLVLQENQ